jgi:transposase
MNTVMVSAAEHTILEALAVSPDLPMIQTRALVVLRAGEGLEDEQIAAEFAMRRKDVLHWRKRFESHGIRGLWDSPGPGTKKRVSPEKESAVLWDVLYAVLHWDAQLLAQQHGLSRSAVNRIFAKHGIVRGERGRIDMEHLKVFADPLFGVTVSGIAGLYYGTSGVLALATTSRAFSELHLLVPSSTVLQAIDVFLGELGKLAQLRRMVIAASEQEEQDIFFDWLKKMEDRGESKSDIHLITDMPDRPPQGSPAVREWLTEHPQFKVHYAPIVKDLFWFSLVRRCFSIITALPVQAELVADVKGMAEYLARIPDNGQLEITSVFHSVQQ